MLRDLVRGHRCGEVQVHRALSFLGAEHVIILSFGLQENVRSPLSIVCLIAIGILAVVTLACTGVVSVKHCSFSIDWKWDFWNCLESVGTIVATFTALFGFNLKGIGEKQPVIYL